MSTMRRQSVRSLAFLQAEWIPMLTDCTSVSIALSQVVRGRPRGIRGVVLKEVGGTPETRLRQRFTVT